LVIIDDLNRPTPSYLVLPVVLRQLQEAGIPGRSVRILIATGTHGSPGDDSVAKKVGSAVASECEIIVHNSERQLVDLRRTSLGTPVSVNKEVISSDYVIGIGGVYPNQTAGFGGGSKLALGVLGFRSIMHLHYRNSGAGWGCSDTGHALRRDLDEIARMINLRTVISVHINAMREVIRLACGDPLLTYAGEVDFARKTFAAPPPGDADVVICNAYPSDLSLTSVHMKGITPLERSAPGASRIVLASCPEGLGHHGLFPLVNRPKLYRLRHIARRLVTMNAGDLARKLARRRESARKNPILLYRPDHHLADLPCLPAGCHITCSWNELLQAVRYEQSGKHRLHALLYPCSPLQVLD
jgi:nickel-dependent lactate racemase